MSQKIQEIKKLEKDKQENNFADETIQSQKKWTWLLKHLSTFRCLYGSEGVISIWKRTKLVIHANVSNWLFLEMILTINIK